MDSGFPAGRLISSGMLQSPERMPPSTWATGTLSIWAAMAQAMVEVTSPTTRHSFDGASSSRRS